MNKISSKILILIVTLGIFLLPLTPSFEIKNNKIALESNLKQALAQTAATRFDGIYGSGKLNPDGTFTGTTTNYTDGTYSGDITVWNGTSNDVVGTWNATIVNGVITQGTWTGNFTPSSTWLGTTAQTQINFNPSIQAGTGVPGASQSSISSDDDDIGCSADPRTWFTNCIVSMIYNLVWRPFAALTRLAASVLDFFIFYSISSTAYTSGFTEKAWGVVRDIANIFFIVALLYVAIKTILSLNVGNNKKLIGTIVVIALIINFSLFVTKIVIDASNILTKVFYNNITPENKNGEPLPENENGERSITVGLVRQFDPQEVMVQPISSNLGEFFLLMIISILIMGYMIFMFLSVAILFVARVASLWILMIFSPLAFASYTVPFEIPGFGHKKFWGDLFQHAFMAPIFVFFLYVVILFGGFLKEIPYDVTDSTDWLDGLMKNIIPFMLIYILLMKAKELAVKYSGEMGQAILSGTKLLGGVAGGAVLGAAAVAGRATLGRAGAALANNSAVKNFAAKNAFGDVFQKSMMKLGSSNLDIRSVKIAGKNLAGVTGANLGEGRKGGFTQMREEKVAKRLKRAKELEVGEDEPAKQALNHAEHNLHELNNTWGGELEKLDKGIETARQNLVDARNADDGSDASREKIQNYNTQIGVLKRQKGALRRGEDFSEEYVDYDEKGILRYNKVEQNYSVARVDGRSIEQIEREDIGEAKKIIKKLNSTRRNDFANYINSTMSNITDQITGLGQYSLKGGAEAAHKIRMSVASGGGGGH
jgi:hypothetical protein